MAGLCFGQVDRNDLCSGGDSLIDQLSQPLQCHVASGTFGNQA